MSQLSLLDLEKAQYIRRWRGKDGKYYYEYPSDIKKKHQAAAKQAVEGGKVEKQARELFTSATQNMGWASLAMVEYLEGKHGISSYEDLKSNILKTGKAGASEIFKDLKHYVDSQSELPTGAKGEILHRIGSALINVVKMLPPEKQAKPKLTVKVQSKKGTEYYKYEPSEAKSPAFPASKVKTARSKLAGWTNMSSLPTGVQVRGMVDKKIAKVVKGKISGKKKFEVVQSATAVIVPWKENAKGVTFTLRQTQTNKKRKSTTALVELTVPYPYARQFINNQITGVQVRNDTIKQMEASAGYKKALGIKVA